ncbi:MAG: hypothetical protein K2X44_00135, partial [Magnetospirillum sp.]|nr:hypothetical protein [Magnetospirillum sp.]
ALVAFLDQMPKMEPARYQTLTAPPPPPPSAQGEIIPPPEGDDPLQPVSPPVEAPPAEMPPQPELR